MLGSVTHHVPELKSRLDRSAPVRRRRNRPGCSNSGRDTSTEVRRRGLFADVDAADMGQAGALCAGRQIKEEVAIAGPLEHVGDAELGV